MKKTTFVTTPVALVLASVIGTGVVYAEDLIDLSPIERLGKAIFNDITLSKEGNQGCVTCHDPRAGWTSPNSDTNNHGAVVEGSISGEFGNRKPPSSAYATLSPRFYADFGDRLVGEGNNDKPGNQPRFIGGNFWDGRATGWKLGSSAADQSQGPFINPVEHALPNPACVVKKVCGNEAYKPLLYPVWSPQICSVGTPPNHEPISNYLHSACDENGMDTLSDGVNKKVSQIYDRIALSIAAFEGSKASNTFTSKVDALLASTSEAIVVAMKSGKFPPDPLVKWTPLEKQGHDLFELHCTSCHTGARGPGDTSPMLTDFSYSNLGVPKNPENPFSIANPKWQDPGLGGFLKTVKGYERYADANIGKVKVPTMRNVALGSCEPGSSYDDDLSSYYDSDSGYDSYYNDLASYPADPDVDNETCTVKAYMHNGYFKSLKSVVHFYNTRDTKVSCESLDLHDATEKEALDNDCWPKPEVSKNVEPNIMTGLTELLTLEQEAAIVAFLQTMSDGYTPPEPVSE